MILNKTPLQIAIEEDNLQMVELLLTRKESELILKGISKIFLMTFFFWKYFQWCYKIIIFQKKLLLAAAKEGNKKMVDLLLSNKAIRLIDDNILNSDY